MYDHPGLRQGERQKHANGKQGDQPVRVAAEDDDEDARGNRQQDDAVGEDQAVAKAGKLARQESVLRQDSRQAGKAGKARVCRNRQDQHRADLDQVIGGAVVQ